MRIPRVRFTVRRLMTAVAVVVTIVALLVTLAPARRRWVVYRDQSRHFAEREQSCREEAKHPRIYITGLTPPRPEHDQTTRDFRGRIVQGLLRKADYYAKLKTKYAAAMMRPWLPAEPDPPEPPLWD